MRPQTSKSCLVTVGTTQFDALISAIDNCAGRFIQFIRQRGIDILHIQIGEGKVWPSALQDRAGTVKDVVCNVFRFAEDFTELLESSDLVIGHAGAGTILEALRSRRRLIVVVNEALMDNHQLELAQHLSSLNYLVYASVGTLMDTLQKVDLDSFAELPQPSIVAFTETLNREMRFG